MLAERLSTLKNWLKYELEWYEEVNWFNKFFVDTMSPNGVLTKPGEEIDPLHRGLITAKGSFNLMNKLVRGKTLSEEERERAREAVWITSLSGNYTLDQLTEREGVGVGITLENNEALKYLSSNADKGTTVAFLSYWDRKHYQYKESSSVKIIQKDNKSWVIFDFPEPYKMPTVDTKLFIYTSPLDITNINPRFSRLTLLLGVPKRS